MIVAGHLMPKSVNMTTATVSPFKFAASSHKKKASHGTDTLRVSRQSHSRRLDSPSSARAIVDVSNDDDDDDDDDFEVTVGGAKDPALYGVKDLFHLPLERMPSLVEEIMQSKTAQELR